MDDSSAEETERVITLDTLTEEDVEELDGLVMGENGEPRFTMEVFDNMGIGPHEE